MSRNVRFYEMICSYSNINFLLDIESVHFKVDHLVRAFKLVAEKHPYYQMKLVTLDNTLQFIGKTQDELAEVSVEHHLLNTSDELDQWQARLISHGSQKRDSSKTLIYFAVFSFENRHQINACINHAGIDGPGVFTTIQDLCTYLDLVLENGSVKVEPKEFRDIHASYDQYGINIEEIKGEVK